MLPVMKNLQDYKSINVVNKLDFIIKFIRSSKLLSCFSLSILFFLPVLLGFNPLTPDLISNVWFINYYKDFYNTFNTFSSLYNAENGILLNVFPCFYGDLAYRICSMISVTLHIPASKSLWIFIMISVFFNMYIVISVFNTKFKNKSSIILTMFICFTTYSITNLYTRGAIMEFMATTFLLNSLCILQIYISTNQHKYLYSCLFCLFFIFSCSMHPITALLGALFVIPILPRAFLMFLSTGTARINYIFLVLLFLFFMGSLGHFIYASLACAKYFTIFYVAYIDIIDNFISRLLPLPFDIRMFGQQSLDEISSPGLIAQVNIPFFLFITIITFFYSSKKSYKFYFFYMTLFFFMIVLSVLPIGFQKIIYLIQFPYRLVTYINFILFLSFFSIIKFSFIENIPNSLWNKFFIYIVISVFCFFSQIYFVSHTYSTQENYTVYHNPSSNFVPPQVYGYAGYAAYHYYKACPSNIETSHISLSKINDTYAKVSMFIREGLYNTNILAFPWNHITVKKSESSAEELKNDTSAIEIPVCVGAGPAIHIAVPDDGDYTIEARFNPPRIWTFLRSIYPWCISLLFSLTCFLAIVSHYHTKRHIPSTTS